MNRDRLSCLNDNRKEYIKSNINVQFLDPWNRKTVKSTIYSFKRLSWLVGFSQRETYKALIFRSFKKREHRLKVMGIGMSKGLNRQISRRENRGTFFY
jgi:hypothetical protein